MNPELGCGSTGSRERRWRPCRIHQLRIRLRHRGRQRRSRCLTEPRQPTDATASLAGASLRVDEPARKLLPHFWHLIHSCPGGWFGRFALLAARRTKTMEIIGRFPSPDKDPARTVSARRDPGEATPTLFVVGNEWMNCGRGRLDRRGQPNARSSPAPIDSSRMDLQPGRETTFGSPSLPKATPRLRQACHPCRFDLGSAAGSDLGWEVCRHRCRRDRPPGRHHRAGARKVRHEGGRGSPE